MAENWDAIFECRLCRKEWVQRRVHFDPTDLRHQRTAEEYQRSAETGYFHECADGRAGVLDLMGFRPPS